MIKNLLLAVIVAILGFTGWYVYHSSKSVNRIYGSISNLNQVFKTTKIAPLKTPSSVTYSNGVPVPADSRAQTTGFYCSSWDPQPGHMMPDICAELDQPLH